MQRSLGTHQTGPCIWMTAGLLTYKLCDHGFDCERCLLDAALRRESPQESALYPLALPHVARVFPDDRLYSTGHLWVQAVEGLTSSFLRVGLDAFAAAAIGCCRSISCQLDERRLQAGETLASIDLGLGVLTIGVPVPGTAMEENPLLRHTPALVVSQPYGSGWIAHLAGDATAVLDGLMPSCAAREQAMCDVRRLRHLVARQLLAEEGEEPSMADGGEMVCDLREILGGGNYLKLLGELIN